MPIIESSDSDSGVIELTNGWTIQFGKNEDSGTPQTAIGIYQADGSKFDQSTVLLNIESREDVVDTFVQHANQYDELDELSKLEKSQSQVVRETARLLPNF